MQLQPGDDLQAALAEADTLHLAAGLYRLEAPLRLHRPARITGTGAVLVRPRTPHTHVAEARLEGTLILEGLILTWAEDGTHLFQSDVLVVAGGQVVLKWCRLAGSSSEHERTNDFYGGSGLRLAGGAVTAGHCQFTDHGGAGIAAAGPLVLEHCVISRNRGIGLQAEGNARVEGCTVEYNGRGGILAHDLALVGGAVRHNRRYGLRLEGPARVEGCAIEANAGPGIEQVGGSLAIQGGAVRRNTGDGLAIAAACHATDVVIAENQGFGIQEGPGATLQLANTSIFGNARGARLGM